MVEAAGDEDSTESLIKAHSSPSRTGAVEGIITEP